MALDYDFREGNIDEAAYNQIKAQLSNEMVNLNSQLSFLYDEYLQNYEHEIGEKLSLISQIHGDNIYDMNMKWALEKSLIASSHTFVDFDDTTWSAIYDMAIQCSENAGHAVYIARSLYNTKEWTNFFEIEDCDIAQERFKNQQIELSEAADIYPNPSNGSFNISWTKDQVAEISIIDADGKLLHKQDVYKGNNQMLLSHLSSGVYFYSISDEQGDLNQGKLIILD